MIRLADGVYTWGYFHPEKKYNFNGFVLCAKERCVVVDPPPMSDDDGAYFNAMGLQPELVVITNRNHLRDRAAWKLPWALHEKELSQVEEKPDRVLREGDLVGPELEVVHLPGKSPGEIGLYWRARATLVLGDALIAPQGRLKLIPEAKLDDPALLKRSLKKLEPLEFETLLVADGDPILNGGKAAVTAFLRGL